MTLLRVRVTPRASRDEVTAFDTDGVLHVRVTAPPADGAANAAVMRLLAGLLGRPPRDIVLMSGATARLKTFDVPLTHEDVAIIVANARSAKLR